VSTYWFLKPFFNKKESGEPGNIFGGMDNIRDGSENTQDKSVTFCRARK
jgi:hypothetical protein